MYPIFGISMFTHMFIIAIVKIKHFLGFKPNKKTVPGFKYIIFRKTLLTLAIAAIIESVFFLVIGSSAAVVYIGILSNKSNFNIIKSAFYNTNNTENVLKCAPKEICYLKTKNVIPDANAPISYQK